MPTVADIMTDAELPTLKNEMTGIINLKQIDYTWDLGQDVDLLTIPNAPVVSKYDSDHMWHAILVTLVNYGFTKEQERGPDWDEEPWFLSLAAVEGRARFYKYPKDIPPELDEMVTARGGKVLGYSGLAIDKQRNVQVSTTGWDAGDSEMKKIINAVGIDINGYVSGGIAMLPGGQATANAVVDFVKGKIGHIDDDDRVGNERFIVDQNTIWGRAIPATKWSGLKWHACASPRKKLWFLTLWRIDLFGQALDLEWDDPLSGGGSGG